MTNITKMASKQQCWALFCISKRDYRNDGLTYDQASDLIKTLGDPNYVKKSKTSKVQKYNDAARIHEEATLAARESMKACTPTPMIVNDGTPNGEFVAGGVCGFADVSFKATTKENRSFLAGLKKAGLAGDSLDFVWRKDTYRGGYQMWVSLMTQSMELKESYARGYNDVLKKNGITAYVHSRMD